MRQPKLKIDAKHAPILKVPPCHESGSLGGPLMEPRVGRDLVARTQSRHDLPPEDGMLECMIANVGSDAGFGGKLTYLSGGKGRFQELIL